MKLRQMLHVLFGLSLICACIFPSLAFAAVNNHPVSVVEADIYVSRFKTTMRLKCFAEDLELLQGVEALEDGLYDSEELVDATKDHADYLGERITIRNAAGELLKPKLKEIIHIEIPEEGIKAGHLMNYTMGFVFEFDYEDPPEFITVQQNMVAEGALLPSELKILLKQAGSDAPYIHMMKPSVPETFRFDWDNPVLTNKASDEEWESWFEEQRKKTLGITSYSSVYSFIYITRHEVRHEVLIPLATLATMIDIERADESFLEIEEQTAAAEKIKKYFSIGNPVKIDSVEVKPVFDRIDFYGLDLVDFAMQSEKRRVSMASGRVGIIMSYSTKGAPSKVEVTWDVFNDAIKSVDAIVFPYDKVEKTQFSMFLENNTYEWIAPDQEPLPPITGIASTINVEEYQKPTINVPLVSVCFLALSMLALASLLFGAKPRVALMFVALFAFFSVITIGSVKQPFPDPFSEAKKFEISDEDAGQVFAQLHKNMFRAFDYRDESDVYDALAKSVDGDLLRSLYLDINRSLEIKEQGGAIARVNEVNLGEGENLDLAPRDGEQPVGFRYRSKWDLVGTIEHWGHIHERENKYEALFKVELRDDAWKITQMQVINEEQGTVKQSLREF